MVLTSDSRAVFRSATVAVVLRLLCSTTAAASASAWPCCSNLPASEPRSSSAFAVLALKMPSCCSSVWVATPLRELTSFMAETKSATRVTSARSSELRLSWAPVSTSCNKMLPSRSLSNSATVSVRRILLVSCISVTAAIETWRDWSIAAREACSSSFNDLPTAPVASSPAVVMVRATSEPWPIIDCEKVWLRASIDLSASEVTRSMSIVSWFAFVPIASTRVPRLPSIICDRRSVCCCTWLTISSVLPLMVAPNEPLAASTDLSTSAEVALTLELTSFDAASSALCAARALFWMLSVVFAVTVLSERSMSVEIALIWLAASAEVVCSEVWASRALFRIEAAVSAPTAVRVRSTSAASVLTWLAASEEAVMRAVCTSRAPERIEAAVALPAAESVRSISPDSDLIWLAASDEAVTSVDCASRALVSIEVAAPLPTAVKERSTSAEVSFNCAPTSAETESSDCWAARAPV